jgi:hypothetical protein
MSWVALLVPAPRRAVALGLALVGYAVLVCALAWPLPRQLGTHLPRIHVSSEYDSLFLAWALAHQTHALATAPSTYPDGNIFHPAPGALFHGETGVGGLPYFAPVFLASGNPILALNVMVLVSVTLTAWAIHFVVERWTSAHAAGFVAAAAFLMTRWVLPGGIAGAPNYAVLQYFPFVVYLSAAPPRSGRRTAALVLALVLQGLTSVYVAAAMFIPLGALACARLVYARDARLALALGAAAVLLVPFYAGHVAIRLGAPGLQTRSFYVGFTQEADLPWGPVSYWTPLGVPVAAVAIVVAGVVAALVRRRSIPARAWRHTLGWAVAGVLMALPPTARFRGTSFRMPQSAFEATGLYDLLRVSDRLGVAGLMGIALATGLAFAHLTARSRVPVRVALALAVAGAMLFEYLRGPELPVIGPRRTHTYFAHVEGFPAGIGVPAFLYIAPAFALGDYPLQDVARFAPPAPLRAVLAEAGGPVLELPVGAGPGGAPVFQARAAFRSIFHWRPVLNGYSRYWPAGFTELMDLARTLPDAHALAELRRRTGLELIVVRTVELDEVQRAAWQPLLGGTGRPDVVLVARARGEALFRIVEDGVGQPGGDPLRRQPVAGGGEVVVAGDDGQTLGAVAEDPGARIEPAQVVGRHDVGEPGRAPEPGWIAEGDDRQPETRAGARLRQRVQPGTEPPHPRRVVAPHRGRPLGHEPPCEHGSACHVRLPGEEPSEQARQLVGMRERVGGMAGQHPGREPELVGAPAQRSLEVVREQQVQDEVGFPARDELAHPDDDVGQGRARHAEVEHVERLLRAGAQHALELRRDGVVRADAQAVRVRVADGRDAQHAGPLLRRGRAAVAEQVDFLPDRRDAPEPTAVFDARARLQSAAWLARVEQRGVQRDVLHAAQQLAQHDLEDEHGERHEGEVLERPLDHARGAARR